MIDRIVGPEAFTPDHVDLQQPQIFLLDNQTEVFLFNSGDPDVCKIEAIFPGGKFGENKTGASHFTLKMLPEGTKHRSANQISEFFDYHGAFLDFISTPDDNQITLYCRSEHIATLIPVFAEIILSPHFTSEQLVKVKEKESQGLQINLQKTSYWASKIFREELFGKNHPYGQLLNEPAIREIDVEALFAYHHKSIKESRFDLLLSGNFNESATLQVLNQYFGQHQIQQTSIPSSVLNSKPEPFTFLELPNSNQASLKVGFRSLARSEKEYPLLALSTKILGGFFGSRLMKVIREDKGLTYGIHASLGHFTEASFFQVGADVKKDAWEEVIELIKIEIRNLRERFIEQDELELVKNYMIGEFQNEVNTTFDLSTKYKLLRYSNLPANYYNNYFSAIRKAKVQDIEVAMNNFIDPDQLVIVAVQ